MYSVKFWPAKLFYKLSTPKIFHALSLFYNLHKHKFWIESEKRYVSLNVSAKGMRIIDKKGIEQVLSEIRARGEKI